MPPPLFSCFEGIWYLSIKLLLMVAIDNAMVIWPFLFKGGIHQPTNELRQNLQIADCPLYSLTELSSPPFFYLQTYS